MSSSAVRLTLYAVISAMEDDMRVLVTRHLEGQLSPLVALGEPLLRTALERLKKDGVDTDDPHLALLLNYVDFGDLFALLNRHRLLFPKEIAEKMKSLTPSLERIVPVRNRVAHTRPLHVDDFAVTIDMAGSMISTDRTMWAELAKTTARLESDPSFVLGIHMPVPEQDASFSKHNLPIPDFDETGFIGRRRQVEDLGRLCLGPYPVISILGEGGIGKTAIALKVAYDVLDRDPCPFEAVVWTTSKTTQLSGNEIVKVDNAIKDSLGLFQSATGQLAGQKISNPMEELLEYLHQFRILLVLDNLETVLDDSIRSFLGNLSGSSKVLITSRIGLGAFEYPVRLLALDEDEAVQLLRSLAKVRGISDLLTVPNRKLVKYCSKMKNNPGFIKWFVSVIHSGSRPEEVLENPDVFLDFCMTNVYGHLNDEAKRVLKSMQTFGGKLTQAELSFLNEMDPYELQKILQRILITNMVVMNSVPRGSSFESQYDLTEMARSYLTRHHPVDATEFKRLASRHQKLVAAGELVQAGHRGNPFSFDSINVRSRTELIVSKYLLDALEKIRRKDYAEADKLIAQAKRLTPEYYEVHRVEAYLRVEQGNYPAATAAYETAIELEPDSAPLRFWYGGFLLRYVAVEASLVQLNEAERLSPETTPVLLEIARANLYVSRFPEAKHVIEKLLSRKNLSEWNRRKAYDLLLQYYKRQAEQRMYERDTFGALESLEGLREAYERCPPILLDRMMGRKLLSALPTGEKCVRFLVEKAAIERARTVHTWLISQVTSMGLTYCR